MRGGLAGKSGEDFGGTLGSDTSTNDIVDMLIELQTIFGPRVANDLDRPRVSRDTLSSLSLDTTGGRVTRYIHTHTYTRFTRNVDTHERDKQVNTTPQKTLEVERKWEMMHSVAREYMTAGVRGESGRKTKKIYINVYIKYIYLYIFTYFESKPLIDYL